MKNYNIRKIIHWTIIVILSLALYIFFFILGLDAAVSAGSSERIMNVIHPIYYLSSAVPEFNFLPWPILVFVMIPLSVLWSFALIVVVYSLFAKNLLSKKLVIYLRIFVFLMLLLSFTLYII